MPDGSPADRGAVSAGPQRYRSVYRTDEQRFDDAIADAELRGAGIVEDDEPTEFSHDAWMRSWDAKAFGEFTAEERAAIRAQCGLAPFVETPDA